MFRPVENQTQVPQAPKTTPNGKRTSCHQERLSANTRQRSELTQRSGPKTYGGNQSSQGSSPSIRLPSPIVTSAVRGGGFSPRGPTLKITGRQPALLADGPVDCRVGRQRQIYRSMRHQILFPIACLRQRSAAPITRPAGMCKAYMALRKSDVSNGNCPKSNATKLSATSSMSGALDLDGDQ